MMKATAQAPANIAFIKYWGKADEKLRLPLNPSISMNLSNTFTETTVEFHPDFKTDDITLVDGEFSEDEIKRTIKSLQFIREKVNSNYFAHVITKNTFPKGAGAAASASGFAALTVAAFAALGLKLHAGVFRMDLLSGTTRLPILSIRRNIGICGICSLLSTLT